ncbi:MAG: hypothetical protein HY313_06365 [Acidobacteria bacterium]|nr:hypothetical protein [Acidobacteriota bacterium]
MATDAVGNPNTASTSTNNSVTFNLVEPPPVDDNTPPTVDAGVDQTITLPALANLIGTAADDGLPSPPGTLTTAWSQISGPGAVAFGNANALSTTASFSVAGTYVLRLTVSDSALSSSDDVTITVDAIVTPEISLSLQSFTFAADVGSNPAPQSFSITNTGGGTLNWTATFTSSSGGNWLNLSPSSGGGNATVSAAVNSAALEGGTYFGTITVSAPGASNSPQTVSVMLTVGLAVITLDSQELVFSTTSNVNPPSQTIQVINSGSGILGWTATVATQTGGNWLSVSPITGAAPSTLTVTVNSADLPTGAYTGTITISALSGTIASNSPQVVQVGLGIDVPTVNEQGVINAASFSTDATVSPGSTASIFGANLAVTTATASFSPLFQTLSTQTETTPKLLLPTTLEGTQVLVNGIPAPLFYVSPTQINFQMPPNVTGPTVQLVVVSAGVRGLPTSVKIAPVAPGIFTTNQQGTGQGAILHADFTQNSDQNPAELGSVVAIYATGLGVTDPPAAAGEAAGTQPLSVTVQIPTVLIGGTPAEVLYSGLAPGWVGLYQVNARIPLETALGSPVPVQIQIGERSSNVVTLAVRAPRPVDTTRPTVTINQAAGQEDPTSTSPINFTVVFSEPVTPSAAGRVTLSGTAGATTAVVTGSGTTYNVAVSGMTTSGSVIATLEAGVATDAAGNPNLASTSTDNTVLWIHLTFFGP